MTRSHTIKTAPKGWTRTAIAQIALVTQGQSPPSSRYNREKRGLPFFQGKANFGLRHPVPEVWCDKPRKIAKKGDILISVRAPVGPVNMCREDCGIGRGLASIRPYPKINSIYVYYHLLFLEDNIAARGTGTTFKAITGDQLRSVVLNIAPPNEQAYIASRIESLFSKIDAARQSLEATMSLLAQNRLSILNHAFTGRLVRHKFNSKPNHLKEWTSMDLGQILQPSKERFNPVTNKSRTFIGLEHIESNTGRILKHGKSEQMESTKTVFHAGDILYGRLRPYLNKVCVPNFDGVCSTDILVLPVNSSVSNKYIALFLSTPEFVAYANKNATGVQHPRISFKKLAELPIPMPSLLEQKRIVSKIESLFSNIDATRQSLETAISLLEQNRLSVLNHAFTGRLVRHKPNTN